MIVRMLLVSAGLLLSASGAALEFSEPVTVVAAKDGVFHHLESSGRRGLAIANGTLAVTWEDNSSGTPQIYVAFRNARTNSFSKPRQVSDKGPAYEPVIAALGNGFVIGWEAEERLWLRSVGPDKKGEVIALSDKPARQLSLNQTSDGNMIAVWGEQHGRHFQIAHGRIVAAGKAIKVRPAGLVDASADKTEQLYPSVVATRLGTLVGWEDRRQGATRICTAFAPAGKAFSPYQILNEFVPSPRPELGSGTGAMRIVLDSDLDKHVTAVWMDKRHFEGGYDVYAAYSSDGGRSFGKNERVYDLLGENTPQWHASVAMNRHGDIVAAWDDTRDGNPDVWYSLRSNSAWGNDEVWPGSNGEGAQTDPVLLFEGRTLHAVWLDRTEQGSAIRYISARFD